MPGLDLFTRRRVRLKQHWQSGPRQVLDAGSGNGWFSYLAYRSGAKVIAVSALKNEVEKARDFYNSSLGVPVERLEFKWLNLYQVETLGGKFDEIICYETLEHIKDDARVCQAFFQMLNPGGVLHLCCPFAEHPRWREEILDLEENGYHVRAGYTVESYGQLLEPIGFQITDVQGIGGPWLVKAQILLSRMRARLGDSLALPLGLLLFPFVWFDRLSPSCPYCLYVRAVKPDASK